MRFSWRMLSLASVLGLWSLTAAQAQDVKLTSYNDLLDRIAQLESEVDSLHAVPAPAANGSYIGGACAPGGCGAGCCDGGACCDQGGFFAMYENVIVRPYFSKNGAFKIEDTNAIVADENASIVDFDWDLEYSPRVEFGALTAGGMGWRARYWHFDHGTTLSVLGDDANGVDSDINVNITDDPDIEIDVSDDEALETAHHMNLNVFDLEGMFRRESCETTLTGSAGLRYVRMDQQYDAREFDVSNGIPVKTEQIRSRHNFEGIGPTLAGEVRRGLGQNGLGVFVGARGSLLFGESDWLATRNDAGDVVDDSVFERSENDLIAVGEVQIGVDYRRDLSNCHALFVRAALETQYWVNGGTGTIMSAEDTTDDGDGDPRNEDFGFFGFTIATGVDW